jgi:hypothetical protein
MKGERYRLSSVLSLKFFNYFNSKSIFIIFKQKKYLKLVSGEVVKSPRRGLRQTPGLLLCYFNLILSNLGTTL